MPTGADVRRLDIRQDDLEADTYDFVHCRALLMLLPDPTAALTWLVAALRPGRPARTLAQSPLTTLRFGVRAGDAGLSRRGDVELS